MIYGMKPLRLGSRRSLLAQRQTQLCAEALHAAHGEIFTEILTFQTSGDAYLAGNLADIGNKGLFTKEIEQALYDNVIDVAVHSMKDMATTLPDGLVVAAMLPRDDIRDVLLCSHADSITALPKGAVFGTSSLRRAVQIQYQRPDIQVVNFRGNIQRRMEKLEAGEVDATMLAYAGLERMGVQPDYVTLLPVKDMVPAVAQGAIGLQCRADDVETLSYVQRLNHEPTMQTVSAERCFLKALDGSCRTPIAGYAEIQGDIITLHGLLASTDATSLTQQTITGQVDEAPKLALTLAEMLRKTFR